MPDYLFHQCLKRYVAQRVKELESIPPGCAVPAAKLMVFREMKDYLSGRKPVPEKITGKRS